MAAKTFLRIVGGKFQQIVATVISAGVANAGDIPALDDTGRLSTTVMPAGFGANTVAAAATEALAAGDFVNLYGASGTFSARKADNSNNRPAHGYVTAAVANAATATVYPLDGVNANLTGLTTGADYWLGTAGAVISTALDATSAGNQGTNKVSQYLGIARSPTELVTTDSDPVLL
ncbi:hypothetical protein ACPA5B_11575 [Pseudomonas solani]|uniref:hypothetical protein n=1 Tax=Pseudomonas solani TaxID=2731552 RepID=UPI003C2B6D3A